MSPLFLIKATGFFFGSFLHLFLLVVFLRRESWDRLRRLVFLLVFATTLWHVGNLGSLVLGQVSRLAYGRLNQSFDALAYLGLALLPPLLLHTHVFVYNKKNVRPAIPTGLVWLAYLPLFALPLSLPLLFQATPTDPVARSEPYPVPFVMWFSIVLSLSGLIDGRIAQHVDTAQERRLYRVLRVYFWATAAGLLYLYPLEGRQFWLGSYIEALVMLSSILPVAILAYYIYRYRYLEIFIQKSIAYALLVLAVLMGYLFGVRQLRLWAESVTGETASLLIESVMMLGLVFMFPALASWIDRQVGQIFKSELKRYSETAERIRQAAYTMFSPRMLVEFTEILLKRDLQLKDARIRLFESDQESLEAPQSGLWKVYPLQAGATALGALEVELSSSEQMATLADAFPLLAGEITAALEHAQLLENKIQLERELAKSSHLASLGQTAATIAHNVKNPLSSMKTLLQLVSEDAELKEEHRSELRTALDEIDRLSKTVTSLLRFSRPDESPRAEELDVEEFFRSLERFFLPQARARNVKIRTSISCSLRVLADREQWLDIFSNLLVNAIEAVDGGGLVELTVDCERDRLPARLYVSVRDNGRGVPESLRERIFDPFITNKQRGTGLGLAIVKRRLGQIGGVISFESPIEQGCGTRFRVEFPIDEAIHESAHRSNRR